jgi:hypothetical protein
MRSSLSSLAAALLVGAGLCGCAATTTAIAKRNLDVQTKMTDSVFLEPVSPTERTVFVEVRNTSDKPDLDLQRQIEDRLRARGYTVIDDPARARFLLQANVLQAGRDAETAAQAGNSGPLGGGLLGGAAGGAVGYGVGSAGGGNNILLAAAGALAGAAIEGLSGALVQDVSYSIVTDVQVSERAPVGQIVTESESAKVARGSTATRTQTSSRTTDLRTQRTRVISSANKVNLDWPEAAPSLVDGLAQSVAGIF